MAAQLRQCGACGGCRHQRPDRRRRNDPSSSAPPAHRSGRRQPAFRLSVALVVPTGRARRHGGRETLQSTAAGSDSGSGDGQEDDHRPWLQQRRGGSRQAAKEATGIRTKVGVEGDDGTTACTLSYQHSLHSCGGETWCAGVSRLRSCGGWHGRIVHFSTHNSDIESLSCRTP